MKPPQPECVLPNLILFAIMAVVTVTLRCEPNPVNVPLWLPLLVFCTYPLVRAIQVFIYSLACILMGRYSSVHIED